MHDSTVNDFQVPVLPLPPVRGAVPLHNHAGSFFSLSTLHRLIRYQCRAFQVAKIDLVCGVRPPAGMMESLLAFAREFQVAVSLRAQGGWSEERLGAWRAAGLCDLCAAGDAAMSAAWLEAAHSAGLPVRLLLTTAGADAEKAEGWARLGVRQVTVVGVLAAPGLREALEGRRIALSVWQAESPGAVISALAEPGGEAFAEVGGYDRAAYVHAAQVMAMSPRAVQLQVMFDNLRLSGIEAPSDRWVIHFLRNHTPLFAPVQAAFRVARHVLGGGEAVAAGAEAATGSGHPVYLDAIDLDRARQGELLETLGNEARLLAAQPPAETFESLSWGFENAYHDPMPGVNQMHALLPGERRSTPLPHLELPWMVSVDFGGGMAEYIGFAVGRHIRIACPMVASSHQLSLYADAAGRYVLLRDGRPTVPLRLAGKGYLPPRLPGGSHLQVAAWSPESALSVTALRVWRPEESAGVARGTYAVSVVVFSTRFSRRLQAVLESVAHQEGVALSQVQCIVGLVPGLDAAEDVLDSIRRVYPELAIEPVVLPASVATAKGFALNECLRQVRAPLTVLLDSDILPPPDFLRTALDASATHGFLAPAGRAMLGPDETARVLLGVCRPWDSFDALAAGAPETRVEENPQEVPLGYCQVFRSEALKQLRYAEYDHFQGADFEFGAALKAHFGGVKRLPRPVLHLHHDTRQWFGAQKQY